MKAVLRGGFALVVAAFALAGPVGPAFAARADLTGAGTVSGDLAPGTTLSVSLHVEHAQGWQHIHGIDVVLDLRGSSLERLHYDPGISSLSIQGDGAPASLGQAADLRGSYFEVNPARVTLSARGKQLRMRIPIRLHAAPPPGARLVFTASAVPLATLGPKPLTPPVGSSGGFSWGTLGLAIAVALFAGGFAGNLFAGRRQPQRAPSIYDAVRRNLEREQATK